MYRDTKQKIMDFLKKNFKKSFSVNQISTKLKDVSKGNVSKLLTRMRRRNQINFFRNGSGYLYQYKGDDKNV